MEVSVLADGDEERQVEHDDEGGEGGVTGDPDPLQVPGKLFPNLDIHLKALSLSPPVQKLELDHKSLISALIFKILKNNHYIHYFNNKRCPTRKLLVTRALFTIFSCFKKLGSL